MEDKKTTCVYCNKKEGVTQDHVPPKSFFPKPRPSNLITVPACLKCNQTAGKDEEFFLATFMFSEAGVSDAGKKLWEQKLRRMYEKNLGLKRKIAQNLSRRNVVTPAGIYLGKTMMIDRDDDRFDNVISKIVKGLYHFEFNENLPSESEISVLFLDTQEKFNIAKKDINVLEFGKKQWPGIFEYRFGSVKENPYLTMWLFGFYSFATFLAITFQNNTKNG